jgi:hypothetical protein
MTDQSTPLPRPHDIGGQPAGEVDQSEHEIKFWEQRVDAMIALLHSKGVISDWAQLRKGVESLSQEDYDNLSYYERWAKSASAIAVAQGLVTQEQLDQRVKALMKNE